MKLKDKVAIVTGVSHPRGIGFATARALLREGATLVVTDISDRLFERAKELETSGCKVAAYQADLSISKEVNDMVQKVLEKFGKVDILVNIAGIQPRIPKIQETQAFAVPFVDMKDEDLERALNSNLKTTFNCTRAVLPSMIKQRYGKIINMSSVTGPIVSQPGLTAYAIAKAGVTGLTHTLALEVAEYGINVNQICPGSIDTGLPLDEIERECERGIPMKRLGKPDEVANLVVFLASDESSYMTGHMMVIDGGNILQELHAPIPTRKNEKKADL
jgi:3-oxoacyl-[acyl-carrier protein] reductase